MILIPISLLALAAGGLLLAKARQHNLGAFLKFVSYFIMIVSFILIGIGTARMICMEKCHRQGGCGPQEQCPTSGRACSEEMKKCCKDMDAMGASADSAHTDGNEVGDHIEKKPATDSKGAR